MSGTDRSRANRAPSKLVLGSFWYKSSKWSYRGIMEVRRHGRRYVEAAIYQRAWVIDMLSNRDTNPEGHLKLTKLLNAENLALSPKRVSAVANGSEPLAVHELAQTSAHFKLVLPTYETLSELRQSVLETVKLGGDSRERVRPPFPPTTLVAPGMVPYMAAKDPIEPDDDWGDHDDLADEIAEQVIRCFGRAISRTMGCPNPPPDNDDWIVCVSGASPSHPTVSGDVDEVIVVNLGLPAAWREKVWDRGLSVIDHHFVVDVKASSDQPTKVVALRPALHPAGFWYPALGDATVAWVKGDAHLEFVDRTPEQADRGYRNYLSGLG